MPETDNEAVVYVSPDGRHEMPLSSPAAQLNWAARGWKPKTRKTTEQTQRQAPKRPDADK